MVKTVTPSRITDGQIDKAVSHYRDLLHKHRNDLGSSDMVQQVLGDSEYLDEQLAVLRRRVEEAKPVLVPCGTITVTLYESHDPDQFYRTRPGLQVSRYLGI